MKWSSSHFSAPPPVERKKRPTEAVFGELEGDFGALPVDFVPSAAE